MLLIANPIYDSVFKFMMLDEKAAKLVSGEGCIVLRQIAAALPDLQDWSQDPLEEVARTLATQTGDKLGKIAQPLRAALTGSSVSPPIFAVMALLGREESLARIGDVLNSVGD